MIKGRIKVGALEKKSFYLKVYFIENLIFIQHERKSVFIPCIEFLKQ